MASARCGRALRRHGFDGSILLVGAEDRPPYNRPPLSKELLRGDLPDALLDAEPPAWYSRRRIELRTGARVTRIDPSSRHAMVDDGSTVAFGQCLLATGARLRRLQIPGAERALMLRTASDARRLRTMATAVPPGSPAVVVGGGFIGLEVASALAGLGLQPAVVEMAPGLWGGSLGTRLAAWGARRLDSIGVELRLASSVTRLDDGAAWVGNERLAASFVVAGIGVVPREELAVRAGMATADGIVVDREQRTSHPAVWAAGDVARTDGLRVEHWHAARESGERAARSMLGLPVSAPPPAWVFSEIAGATLDVIGSTEGWDTEGWVAQDRLLAYMRGGRVVGLASIGGTLAAEPARTLIARGASLAQVEADIE